MFTWDNSRTSEQKMNKKSSMMMMKRIKILEKNIKKWWGKVKIMD